VKHKARFDARLAKHATTVYVNGTNAQKAFIRALDSSTASMYMDEGDYYWREDTGYVLYMSTDVALTPGTDTITYNGTSYDIQNTAEIYIVDTAIAQIVLIANIEPHA
jgi:hypothetical protein